MGSGQNQQEIRPLTH